MNFLVSNAKKTFMGRIFSKNDDNKEKNPPLTEDKSKKDKKDNNVHPKLNLTIKESGPKQELNFDLDDDDIHTNTSNNSSKSSENPILSFEYTEKEEDPLQICHRVYPKKSMLDIEQMTYVPFIKKKKTETVFSLFGFGNKKPIMKDVKYFAVFDENFIYMINMTLKENNQNNFYKRLGNHYDLTKISNIDIKNEENGRRCIILLFILDNDINTFKSVIKEFRFDYENAVKFFKILKYYLMKLKIPLNYKNEEFAKMNNSPIS